MENIEKIKGLAQKAGVSDGKLTEEFLFTINMVDYFYYNRNIGEQDIRENFVDGASDGGIDYIYVKEDQMYLIQGKSSSQISFNDIRDLLFKMSVTVKNFEDSRYDNYNENLKSTFLNAYDSLSDEKNINLILFTNTQLTDDTYDKIMNLKAEESLRNYNITIYDKNEIDNKILNSEQGNDCIKEDSLELESARNVLRYNDNGIIVNIRANSLKTLYIKQAKKGLFSFNLREYISKKDVDGGIENTIKNDKDKFWFYNNGITIGCEDFLLDGNKLKLYGFSIINGAQTTTKIGESKIIGPSHDFSLVCKVVKAENSVKSESDFIMKISEASNSQKPIRARDLKANLLEQKKLQNLSMKNQYPLAIEIKRGVKPTNYNKVEPWQRITNEYMGQLIAACLLQQPGTARSGKANIFNSPAKYNEIYVREHDYNILYDLVKLARIYDDFKKEYTEKESDVDNIAICSNGKFTVLAVMFYFYKYFTALVINSSDDNLRKDNIKNTMLTLNYKEDDYEVKIKNLYRYIIRQLKTIYKTRKEELKLTSYSNFFKTDSTYQNIILHDIDELLKEEMEFDNIKKCMTVFERIS